MSASLNLCLALVLVLTLGCSKTEDDKKSASKTPAAPTAQATPTPAAPTAQATPTPAAPTVQATTPTPAAAPPPHPPMQPAASAATMKPPAATQSAQAIPQSGKVTEVKQAGSYTYLQVEAKEGQFWLATNQFEPKIGEVVHWGQSSVMQNFYSKALNQTFPMVLFVGAVLPGPAPTGTQAAPAPAPTGAKKGKVHEVMQSGGYTYIQVDSATGPWLAVPTTEVKTGNTVAWEQGTLMKNFTSKTLNRTFDEIAFLGGIKVE